MPQTPLDRIHEGEALKAQIACLGEVFTNPDLIPLLFTEDYEQTTDGKLIHRAEFETHVRHVKASVRSLQFTVLDAVRQGDRLADRHTVEIHYLDNRRAVIEVYLFAELRDGRFARVNEVTRVLSGDEAAQALASALA